MKKKSGKFMCIISQEQNSLLTISQTQLESATRLAKILNLNIDLKIKRDDLYPQTGGGSKSRKIIYIVRDALQKSCDALVTNGSPQSNHARATAIMAANLGLRCHLVIVLDPLMPKVITGNLLLMKMSGASIEFCEKHDLATQMDHAIRQLKSEGFKPMYVWGGGHGLPGVKAFVDAAMEARQQCGEWIPDYVFLASGTGSTQAGLTIGYSDLNTKIIGISVARDSIRGSNVIRESIEEFQKNSEFTINSCEIIFRDDWVSGGYSQTNPDLLDLIRQSAKAGYYFDPTYSGKAMQGLVEMVRKGEISEGSKVLFWHTGGIMNLISSKDFLTGGIRKDN